MRKILKLVPVIFLLLPVASAIAESLPEPSGRILLEMSGNIGVTNQGSAARFDVDMLQDLEWSELETYTAYTEGPQVFAGPTLQSVLDRVDADGKTLRATAINGYFVEFPASEAEQYNVVLAMMQNGEVMRVRDKGPIWVIYPMTQEQASRKEHDNEMIWQLNQIVVVD